jgi:two-component system chemotaxis response regulator CheB
VLVVDDSALMRKLLSGLLATDPGIEVVGAAPDPIVAWEMIKKLRPHVLTLDVEMPRMDGISFLERLMTHFPMPVVMVSSRTEKGCATGMRALELGAVEIVAKPGIDLENDGIVGLAEEIVNKVLAARAARVRPWTGRPAIGKSRIAPAGRSGGSVQDTHVVAMGASTGGTEALREVLMALPADAPGIVVVQHMPGTFTRSFADRLDGLCQVRVKEAVDGDPVLAGHVLIAPGGWHMEVVRSGATSHVRIRQGPLVNGFRPSVDLLFSSCADQIGPGALGVILTGMGSDGAQGLRRMRDAGAHTIAQDEATCVVFGMPKAAIALGGAVEVSPIDEVAGALMREVRRERSAAKGPPLIVAEPGR